MVGKLPNCSQARRSRTEERKRDLWIRQSPPRSQSRAMLQAQSFTAASEGWMSENQILLADRKKYFFLDIPFYRTSPHPRRRLSELRDKRATLTPHWYKRSGNPGCPRGIKFGR